MDLAKAKQFKIKEHKESHVLTTIMGKIENNKSAKVRFKLPQFSPTMELKWKCDVIPDMSKMPYDMILGRDIMQQLNIDVIASDLTVTMAHIKVPWSDRNAKTSSLFNLELNSDEDDSADRIKKILDAKYEPADLEQVIAATNLSQDQKNSLLQLLQRYEDLFDGTLGTFNMKSYDIELNDNVTPYHLKRAYTVPQAYIATLKNEVKRLCDLDILEEINNSEWAAGTFIIPKKDGSV